MKRNITHGLLIATIVIAAFIAAIVTPSKIYAKTTGSSEIINIAKVDYENRTQRTESKMIADNEIPLAAAPSETESNMTLWWVVIAASAVISGIVIVDDLRDRRSK